jgi:excisionase family DNA binding protein
MIRDGDLAAHKLGREYRIPAEDLREYYRSHSQRAEEIATAS